MVVSFTFENQGTNTYLVYEIEQVDNLDTMSLGMLTNNKISGLASTVFTQIDDTKYIKYNVSSKVSVKQYFSGPVNKKRLLGVFKGIVDAMLSAEDYMIDINTILMDLDYIFTDVSTCETVLICLPIVSDANENINLGSFFKDIMFNTQFDQTENCDYIAKIINYLNSAPTFSLVDFKSVLESISNGSVLERTIKTQPVIQNNSEVQQPVVPQKEKKIPVQSKIMSQPVQIPTANPEMNIQNIESKKSQTVNAPNQPIQKPTAVKCEKKITLFSLLMHYNKENVEVYKAQKAARRSTEVPVQVKQNVLPKNNNLNKVSETPYTPNVDFAIPGQPNQSSNQAQPIQQSVNKKQTQGSVPQNMGKTVIHDQSVYQQSSAPKSAPQSRPMNFGETTVLGGGLIGETTVLNAGVQQFQTVTPYLIRSKNNEKILLNKSVFKIGKERSYVDYFIGDNTAISRSHANIITREGKYYIVDTNSTNHTYLNGQMLKSNAEVEIEQGSKIRLANEDFEFRLF